MKAGHSYLLAFAAATAATLCVGTLLDGWIEYSHPRQAFIQAIAEGPRVMRIVLASGSSLKTAPTVVRREILPVPARPRPPLEPIASAKPSETEAEAEIPEPGRQFAPAEGLGPADDAAAHALPAVAGRAPAEPRMSPPAPLGELRPVYPMSARRRGLEGAARVRVVVGADGAPLKAELVSSSGHAALDQAALAAVLAAGYRPAESDGRNVQGELVVPMRFVLVER